MSGYELKDSVREKYTPIVKEFIDALESVNIEVATELLEKDFSDCELSPYTLEELLKSLGYEEISRDENGWQLDFWITMRKAGFRDIQIRGCGMTFELSLHEIDE